MKNYFFKGWLWFQVLARYDIWFERRRGADKSRKKVDLTKEIGSSMVEWSIIKKENRLYSTYYIDESDLAWNPKTMWVVMKISYTNPSVNVMNRKAHSVHVLLARAFVYNDDPMNKNSGGSYRQRSNQLQIE